MGKSVLNLIEINLLLNSEEPKNTELYGNLYSALSEIKNLKAVSLDELSSLDNKAKSALSHNKKNLIDATVREWRATTTILERPQRNKVCELCNTPIKYLCYIFNFKNSIELRVGSECIKKFPNMDGYIQHNEQLRSIHKSHKVVSRRNKFYNAFPDCEKFISDADKYFSSLPILVPYEIYSKLQDVITRMRLIFTMYINENKKPFKSNLSSIELFQLAVKQYQELKIESDVFVSKNIDSPLVCKRREIDWLISNNKIKLLEKITRNNGRYNKETLSQMSSYTFISDYIENIFNRNQSQLFTFFKINESGVYLSFNKQGYQSPIIFKMTLEDFMCEIGANCIVNDKHVYNLNAYIKKVNILFTKSNLESVISYISIFVYKYNCVFLFDDINNNLILCRRGDKAVRNFDFHKFLNAYSLHIQKSDEEIKKYIFEIVKSNKLKWISSQEQSKQGIDERINKLYKEQYLDIKDQFIQYNRNKYVEITTYKLIKDKIGNTIIDFTHPEIINISRRQIRLSDNSVKYTEYAILITDGTMFPIYNKGTLLFVQSGSQVKNGDTIFFCTSDNGLSIKKCHTFEERENIFKHIPTTKKNILSYGKIIYSLIPNIR